MMKKILAPLALAAAATILSAGVASASPVSAQGRAADPGDFTVYIPIQFVEELLGEWTAVGHDAAWDEAAQLPG